MKLASVRNETFLKCAKILGSGHYVGGVTKFRDVLGHLVASCITDSDAVLSSAVTTKLI